jgi:hypothetical protein
MRWSAPSFRGFRMLVCLGLDSLLVDDCIYRQVGGIDEDHFPAAARPQAGDRPQRDRSRRGPLF